MCGHQVACELYLSTGCLSSVNVAPSNRPLASSRFPTAVQLPPSADGGVFGKVCRAPLFLLYITLQIGLCSHNLNITTIPNIYSMFY